MNDRALGVLAGLIGAVGMVLQVETRLASGRLSAGTLPAWAVFGTAGQSTVAYLHLLELAAFLLIVLLPVGLGYYAGRERDSRPRAFVRTVAAGSALGVALVTLRYIWPSVTSIGGHSSAAYGSQATEMLVMDVVLPAVYLVRSLGEVALLVTIGALAGAALAQFRAGESPSTPRTETDTDDPSAAASTAADETPDPNS